ncbi:MAG: flagellar biosynthetic protein FliR [Gemmatimonadaceae bacterium]
MSPAPGPWDFFAPGAAEVTILSACRVGGLVLIAPMFASKTVPMPVRTALLLVLTLVMQPVAQSSAIAGAGFTPATFLTETLIGFSMGFGAALLVGAAELAADLSSQAIGLSGAAVLDPVGGHQTSVLGQFFGLLAATLLLASNGHHVMLDAVASSFGRIPVGATPDVTTALQVLIRQGSVLFVLGLQIAAPVIAAALVTNAGLGILSRAVPQLNLMNLAFPMQIGIGIITLAASLPFLGLLASGWGDHVRSGAGEVISALLNAAR